MAIVRFSFLTGDINWAEYGGVWISQKLNNGDSDYWLVRGLVNGYECLEYAFALSEEEELRAQNAGELIGKLSPSGEYKYMCTLSSICPAEFTHGESAATFVGIGKTWDEMTDFEKVEAIHGYTSEFVEFRWYGNSYRSLFKACQQEANGLV